MEIALHFPSCRRCGYRGDGKGNGFEEKKTDDADTEVPTMQEVWAQKLCHLRFRCHLWPIEPRVARRPIPRSEEKGWLKKKRAFWVLCV